MSAIPSEGNPSKPSESEAAGLDETPARELAVAPSTDPAAAPDSPENRAHASTEAGTGELSDAAEAAVAAGPKRPVKGTSRLGLLALFAGVAACVLCRPSMLPPSLRLDPATPALSGMILAFLALAGILIGSRAKSGLPLLAMLACLTAIGISGYQSGVRDVGSTRDWANAHVQRYSTLLNQLKNRITPATGPNPANPAHPGPVWVSPPPAGPGVIGQTGTPANPGPAATPVNPDAGVGSDNIFGIGSGSAGSSPGVTGAPPLPAPPVVGTAGPGAASGPSPLIPAPGGSVPVPGVRPGTPMSPRVVSAQAALRTAQEKVRVAEGVFRNSFVRTNNPEYLAARAEVDAADKLVEDAKRRSDGFGQPVIDATEQRKKAQEKAARIMNDAMARDPAVAASRRDLAAAEDSLRQAYDQAGQGR
jgi:hypothetical protein